ncbi:MAG: hypothetical protein J3K34DRAFT_522271 [Monoraphidium minutum]|nr:MAG: hypothetical protein J3K34DRAFT_522271 [Monoraphidium minutum]
MYLVLVKQHIQLDTSHHIHGGRHAFACLARALAAAPGVAGTALVFAAPRAAVLHAAAAGSWLHQLRPLGGGGGGGGPEGAAWRRGRVEHRAVFRAADLAAAAEQAAAAGGALPARLAALAAAGACALHLFVQNLHLLPFGPAGCARRAPALLASWRRAAGVLCVSRFVEGYLRQHAAGWLPGGGGSEGGGGGPQTRVVSLAALGVFGPPPWPDCGAAAAQRLWPDGGPGAPPGSPRQQQAGGWARRPVIGMLKVTPEKGAAVLAGLAARMPDCDFLAVHCTAPPAAAAAGGPGGHDPASGGGGGAADGIQSILPLPPNVQLVAPTADLDGLISEMDLVIMPSLLQEAFGMALVDAALRGVPAVAASAGALAEAGGGAAAEAPVSLAACHAGGGARGTNAPAAAAAACGAHPSWALRRLPREQPLDAWEAAARRLLAGREAYAAASRAARTAAMDLVGSPEGARAEVAALAGWLAGRG